LALTFILNGKEYTVKSVLGQGGFSTVYETTEEDALKCIPVSKKDYTPEEIYHFYVTEKQALHALRGSSVIQLYASAQNEEYYFLVLEKFGYSLDDILESRGFNEAELLPLFKRCLEAVDFIHEKGYAHRDINLLNILMKKSEIKITDFGFCQPFHLIQTRKEWENEFLHGMIGYVAPEVLEVPEYDHYKRDIFGLGRSFYKILTSGQIPYQLDQSIPPLEDVALWGTPALFKIVNKMIAIPPQERYSRIRFILKDFEQL
jgi:serine/threonine protein kinase